MRLRLYCWLLIIINIYLSFWRLSWLIRDKFRSIDLKLMAYVNINLYFGRCPLYLTRRDNTLLFSWYNWRLFDLSVSAYNCLLFVHFDLGVCFDRNKAENLVFFLKSILNDFNWLLHLLDCLQTAVVFEIEKGPNFTFD